MFAGKQFALDFEQEEYSPVFIYKGFKICLAFGNYKIDRIKQS